MGDDANSGDPKLHSEFTEEKEVWLGVLQVELDVSKSSNKLVLKFGRPHPQQYQLISVCSKGSYRTVGIHVFKQFCGTIGRSLNKPLNGHFSTRHMLFYRCRRGIKPFEDQFWVGSQMQRSQCQAISMCIPPAS